MQSRPLSAAERSVLALDRAFTMNFSVVARVRGHIDRAALSRALGALTLRHPLLGARLERRFGVLYFKPGCAQPISIGEQHVPVGGHREQLEAALLHGRWDPRGARVRCLLLRHDAADSTLVLTFHHVASDGKSGVIAMRDLLTLLARPGVPIAPLDAPPAETFVPRSLRGLRTTPALMRKLGRDLSRKAPDRFRAKERVGAFARRNGLVPLVISRDSVSRLHERGRRDGFSMHGIVSAAITEAVKPALARDTAARIRIFHPVDLRTYVGTLDDARGTRRRGIGESVGYYVSGLESEHVVADDTPLFGTAREVTRQVREKKAAHDPLLFRTAMGAVTGPLSLVLGGDALMHAFEQHLSLSTLSASNLGALEDLGVERRFGGLELESLHFAGAPSVTSSLGVSISTFDGVMTINFVHVEPHVPRWMAEGIATRTGELLFAAAGPRVMSDISQLTGRDSVIAIPGLAG